MDMKWIIFIAAWGMLFSRTQKSIPVYLQECYENSTIQENRTPMNLRVLIDLIRKVERHSETSMDMRSIAVSLLHRFKFDGIEYHSDMIFQEGVLPFSRTGTQRWKNRIIEELIPGKPEEFPDEALTLPERCALHRAISNTVWKDSPTSQDKMCIDDVTTNNSVKICPIEYGVISTPFGTIAPGAIIAAIAASLQNVTPRLGPNTSNSSEEDEIRNIIANSVVDSIWAATVAGDLAETVVYQGPVVGKRMVLGDSGFWNNSLRPYTYYLEGRDGTFDSTQAEIIGAIDGLIIAKKLPGWIEKFPNLRLSQVLDMYYSKRRVQVDGIVTACDRRKIFWHVAPRSIVKKQTYAISYILDQHSGVSSTTKLFLETMVNHAVAKFAKYTNNHLFMELHCQKIEKIHPRVEAIVAFDGAWSQEYTADFLAVLFDDIDVSVFGSKIGILHGTTGEWMLNVTSSPVAAYEAFDNFQNFTWPSEINFTKVFASASDYYDKMWSSKHKNYVIGSRLGQVIIFLATRVRFTTPIEQESILESLKKLKEKYPGLHFVYYVSVDNAPLFEPFLLSANDHLVKESRIKDALLNVSRVLRPAPCNLNVPKGTRDQIEDYVSPQESIVYRLDPLWPENIENLTLTIQTVDYGTIEVCTWNQGRNNATREGFYCYELSGHNETTTIYHAACIDRAVSFCNNTMYYRIRGTSTRNRCTEIDCRTPEHIRFKFDGVKYDPNVISQPGVLPFDRTGSQRLKNRVMKDFIPGTPEAFPDESLTLLERCALHRAISNTVWEHSPVSEDKICTNPLTEHNSVKICPMEYGVISTPFGTTAPGTIIAAIAASLEPKDVTLIYGPNPPTPPEETEFSNEEETNTETIDNVWAATVAEETKFSNEEETNTETIDDVWAATVAEETEFSNEEETNTETIDNVWAATVAEESKFNNDEERMIVTIDNVWAATVAGELAESVMYQGPLLGERMVLGDIGFWSNSSRSNTYYLMGRDGTFDATQAEIIGAIDGLIIAKELPKWIHKFRNLRLSQVLDMYYSNRGVQVDEIVRACDRGRIFSHVAPKTIMEAQTYTMSQILEYYNDIDPTPEIFLKTIVNYAVDKFTAFTNNSLFTEFHCLKTDKIYPRVEAIVAFDGAWSQEYTADFLGVLLDDIDVSVFGSKIGILHGTSGEWMLKVTSSPVAAYEAFDRFQDFTWPSEINFTKVFASANDYYDKMWSAKHENHTFGNLGQVIVFLVAGVRFITPTEQESSLESLKKLKKKHPHLHFVYYASVVNAPLFSPFLLSANDHLVKESSINDALLNVPRILRPPPCSLNVTEDTSDQIEDYVSPQESIVYRLDLLWRRNGENVIHTVQNVDYGTIEVCIWKQSSNNATREGFYCRELSGHNEMTIIDYATCNDRAISSCRSTTHYQIRGISTRSRCTEIDCRTPEHIKYILSIEN